MSQNLLTAPVALFGIEDDTLNLAINLIILIVVAIWLALVYWTYADAKRRIADRFLILCAVVGALFPFIGTAVYAIVRPSEYLDDVRERELEIEAAKAKLKELNHFLCDYCDHRVENDFLVCPNCHTRLRNSCRTCSKPIDPNWQVCPYCESPTNEPEGNNPSRRRRRVAAPLETVESAVHSEGEPSAS